MLPLKEKRPFTSTASSAPLSAIANAASLSAILCCLLRRYDDNPNYSKQLYIATTNSIYLHALLFPTYIYIYIYIVTPSQIIDPSVQHHALIARQ